ncbi:MAG TPA: acyltransferase family protein, partial [Xanthobacteraceae bacterium]
MNPPEPAQSHDLPPLRTNWLDTARGFGIILVVLGHVLRGLVSVHVLTWTGVTKFFDGWIYTFHMPLFFFLSGLLLFKSMKSSWKGFIWGKVRTIAYPYFVWSAITIAIKSVLGSLTSHPYHLSDLPLILYQPIDQFWFLYVLFLLFLAVSALLKLGAKPWVVLSLAVLFYCGILPVPIQWGILFETRMFAIYFSLGVCIGWARDLTSLSRIHVGLLLFIIGSGLALSSLGGLPQLSERGALMPLLALAGTAAFV